MGFRIIFDTEKDGETIPGRLAATGTAETPADDEDDQSDADLFSAHSDGNETDDEMHEDGDEGMPIANEGNKEKTGQPKRKATGDGKAEQAAQPVRRRSGMPKTDAKIRKTRQTTPHQAEHNAAVEFKQGDIVQAPQLDNPDEKSETLRLLEPCEGGWKATTLPPNIKIAWKEDSRGKSFIVQGGGKPDKWFTFGNSERPKHGSLENTRQKAEEEKAKRETEAGQPCLLLGEDDPTISEARRQNTIYSLTRARYSIPADLHPHLAAQLKGQRDAGTKLKAISSSAGEEKGEGAGIRE